MLAYLRANGFKTFIVSGGGIEFMRPWTEKVYGIPPEQVIGSSLKTRFEMRDGKPVLVRLPEMNFVDDKAGKPGGRMSVETRLRHSLSAGRRSSPTAGSTLEHSGLASQVPWQRARRCGPLGASEASMAESPTTAALQPRPFHSCSALDSTEVSP